MIKINKEKILQRERLSHPRESIDLANGLGYFSVEAEVEYVRMRKLSNN